MTVVSASAPGKVILFGEHAVVYGQPAIAVPLDQVRARAVIVPDVHLPSGEVRIYAPDIGLEASLSELPVEHPLAAAVRGVLAELGFERPPTCRVHLTSTIAAASGLGSGAAVSVALIRALSAYLGRPLPVDRVSALAFEVEKLHHGTPSGIDNTVIAYNRPIYFVRQRPIETLAPAEPLHLVVADSGIPSHTAQVVSAVRQAWQADTARYEALFQAIGAITQEGRYALEAGQVARLGALMDENHRLLVELGVSSPELDRLVTIARRWGALGAKLCGAGRGGNIVALTLLEDSERLARALQEAGATRTLISTVRAVPRPATTPSVEG